MSYTLVLLLLWHRTCRARPEVHLVSFGQGAYVKEVLNFTADAEATGYFDHIHVFTELPESVAADARWKQHLESSRGYGYWFWKSVLTSMVLENMTGGDVLVYEDAGGKSHGAECCPVYASWTDWGNLLEALCDHGLIATQTHYPEDEWTKGDIWMRFNLPSKAAAPYKTGQVAATSFMLRKSHSTEKFISLWQELASDFHLISDEPSDHPNSPQFHENRHDQSLFSMLVKSSNPQVEGKVLPEAFELNKDYGIEGLRPLLLPGYKRVARQHDEYRFRVHHGNDRLAGCPAKSCRKEARNILEECMPTTTSTNTSTTASTSTFTIPAPYVTASTSTFTSTTFTSNTMTRAASSTNTNTSTYTTTTTTTITATTTTTITTTTTTNSPLHFVKRVFFRRLHGRTSTQNGWQLEVSVVLSVFFVIGTFAVACLSYGSCWARRTTPHGNRRCVHAAAGEDSDGSVIDVDTVSGHPNGASAFHREADDGANAGDVRNGPGATPLMSADSLGSPEPTLAWDTPERDLALSWETTDGRREESWWDWGRGLR